MSFLPEPWMMHTAGAGLIIAGGLIVWFLPVGKKAGFWLIGLGAALIFGGLVAGTYEDRGDEKRAAKDKPIIEGLKTDLATSQKNEAVLKKVIGDTNLYVDQLQAQIKTAKDTAAKVIEQGKKQAAVYDETINGLLTKLNAAPTLDVTAAGVAAQKIIEGLIETSR